MAAGKTRLVDYHAGHRAGVLRLMSSVPYKAAIWDWQFESNPFGHAFTPIVVTHGSEVVGFNGEMSVDILYHGKQRRAIWSCDFYVNAEYRSKGIGKIIKQHQFAENPVIMALGLSEVAAHVWQKKGCQANTDICVMRRYGNIRSARELAWSVLQWGNRLRGMLHRPAAHRCESHISDSLPPAEQVDQLWRQVAAGYAKMVVRHHAYLHWRYQQFPLGRYQFIHVRRDGELVAVGVFRASGRHSRFVDLLAAAGDLDARLALVSAWQGLHPDCDTYTTVTTDALLIRALSSRGFIRTRDRPWFFVHSALPDDAQPQQDWFLMPGDSDGEFLDAAASHHRSDDPVTALRIEQVSDSQAFHDLREAWQDLLARSEANRLFLGWEWQYSWWQTWAADLNLQLVLLLAWRGEQLVGIAPLYLDRLRLRGGYPVRRLQFVGNAWRRQGTVRTEYLEFIADRRYGEEVCRALGGAIGKLGNWDELVICDLPASSMTYRSVVEYGAARGWHVEAVDRDKGVKIGTLGNFADYVNSLGRNTRRKLFHRRSYLQSLGAVRLQDYAATEIENFLQVLNGFHRQRWGKDCFAGHSMQFHQTLLGWLPARQAGLSCITLDGRPVSVLYNLRAGNTVYNIQSGFEDMGSKLSLGTLHMGYAIEAAFDDTGVVNFDLLAGGGKNEFYKTHYRGEQVEFVTLRVTAGGLLRRCRMICSLVPERLMDAARYAVRRLRRRDH